MSFIPEVDTESLGFLPQQFLSKMSATAKYNITKEVMTFLEFYARNAWNQVFAVAAIKIRVLTVFLILENLTFSSIMSNTSLRQFSSGYPNTEKRVENMTHSRVFLMKFKVIGCPKKHCL